MLPYVNQGLAVLKKNHLAGFHIIDALDFKGFPNGLPKFTSMGFARIVFKSIILLELTCFFRVLNKFLLV